MTALGQQLAGDVKADKTRRTGDQNRLIRHRIPKGSGSVAPAAAYLPAGLRVSQYPVVWLLPDWLQNHTKAAKFGVELRCF
jgi:hypothetical protein